MQQHLLNICVLCSTATFLLLQSSFFLWEEEFELKWPCRALNYYIKRRPHVMRWLGTWYYHAEAWLQSSHTWEGSLQYLQKWSNNNNKKNSLRLRASQSMSNYSTQAFLWSRSAGRSSRWLCLNCTSANWRASRIKGTYNKPPHKVAHVGVWIYHGSISYSGSSGRKSFNSVISYSCKASLLLYTVVQGLMNTYYCVNGSLCSDMWKHYIW